ncbi:carbonic anhydrase 6-like [Ornithodoros turicata]|uniref:carbonic anhydrase 6-like n=1 Tax=Ornithodoros turicata TaxID=34597 RepID=UPI003139EDF1
MECSCGVGPTYGIEWSYDSSLGPSKWPRIFAKCKGSRQSPVAISTSMVHMNRTLGRIYLRGFSKIQQYTVENVGATVVVTATPGQLIPRVENPSTGEVYIFDSLHFHWTSEHVVNGVRFAMEAHFVLYNGKYKDINSAREHDDGLEVVAALFQVRALPNPKLRRLLSGISRVLDPHQKTTIAMALDDLLPVYISTYFRYPGSLTTPLCDEVVTWTLLYPPSSVGAKQAVVITVTLRDRNWPTTYKTRTICHGRLANLASSMKDTPVARTQWHPGSACTNRYEIPRWLPLVGRKLRKFLIGVLSSLRSAPGT